MDKYFIIFLAIGFLGAYTTFSTYTYESVQMLLNGIAVLSVRQFIDRLERDEL